MAEIYEIQSHWVPNGYSGKYLADSLSLLPFIVPTFEIVAAFMGIYTLLFNISEQRNEQRSLSFPVYTSPISVYSMYSRSNSIAFNHGRLVSSTLSPNSWSARGFSKQERAYTTEKVSTEDQANTPYTLPIEEWKTYLDRFMPLDGPDWSNPEKTVLKESSYSSPTVAQLVVEDLGGAPLAVIRVYRWQADLSIREVLITYGDKLEKSIKISQEFYDYISQKAHLPKENAKIGVFDFETCPSAPESEEHQVYAYSYIINKPDHPIHITPMSCVARKKEECGSHIIDQMLDSILAHGKGYTFYAHNFAKFDGVFLLRVVSSRLLRNNRYQTKVLYNSATGQLLSLQLCDTRSTRGGWSSKDAITFKDSILIIPGSLRKIASDLKVEHEKGTFPYKFVHAENLNYSGTQPDQCFYEVGANPSNTNLPCVWSLYDETLKYIEIDVKVLITIIIQVHRNVWSEIGLNITNHVTYSGLSLALFRAKYVSGNTDLPIVTGRTEEILRTRAYRGGLVHAPQPLAFNKSAYEYDVIGIYPSVIKNPMPGGNVLHINQIDLEHPYCFGFANATVQAPEGKLACLLPIPTVGGKGIFQAMECPDASREYSGIFFTEELKAAREMGYKIKVYGGYQFDKIQSPFTEFMNHTFKRRLHYKLTGNATMNIFSKLVINSLYGRMAIHTDLETAQLITSKQHELFEKDKLWGTRTRPYDFGNGVTLVVTRQFPWSVYTMLLPGDLEVARDVSMERFNNILSSHPSYKGIQTSIPASIATTAYARIIISTFKNISGNPLLYSDTDSVYLEHPLPQALCEKYGLKGQLGYIELKRKVHDFYVKSPKWYTYKTETEDGTQLSVVKSAGAEGVTHEALVASIVAKTYVLNARRKASKNLTKGSVSFSHETSHFANPQKPRLI